MYHNFTLCFTCRGSHTIVFKSPQDSKDNPDTRQVESKDNKVKWLQGKEALPRRRVRRTAEQRRGSARRREKMPPFTRGIHRREGQARRTPVPRRANPA